MGEKLFKYLSPIILILLFSIISFLTFDNAPIHRDDVIWVELTRDLFSRDWSFFGEIASTGHFRHSILAPLINYPVALFDGGFDKYIVYVLLMQIGALALILLSCGRKDSLSFCLIILFVLFRPTIMLFHIHKVWQYTYYIVVSLGFFSVLYSFENERRKKMLFVAFLLAGLGLHFHLSAICFWPFLYIFSSDLSRKERFHAIAYYVVGANVMLFQSMPVFGIIAMALSLLFLSGHSPKVLGLFRLSFILATSIVLVFELKMERSFAPLKAIFEQLPSNGQFFFDMTSYYHFPLSHRWLSFEIVMLVIAVFLLFRTRRFESFEGKLLSGILTVTTLVGLYGLLSTKKLNPHHWHMGVVIGLLFFIATSFNRLRYGKLLLVTTSAVSLLMLGFLQYDLKGGGRGYYMTTYSKRLELLDEICASSRGPVSIKSVVNSYVAWEFMIGEHPCLTFTNNLSVTKVIINERLFPWREQELILQPAFHKKDWINGEVWYRNSL